MKRTSQGRAIVRTRNWSVAFRWASLVVVDVDKKLAELSFIRDGGPIGNDGLGQAPRRRTWDRFQARSVAMAKRNTLPIAPRKRRALSLCPRFSTFFKTTRISAAVISMTGRGCEVGSQGLGETISVCRLWLALCLRPRA